MRSCCALCGWKLLAVALTCLAPAPGANAQAPQAAGDSQAAAEIEAQLVLAGDNRAEIERALRDAPESQRPGMRFLVRYMPERDLQSLTADFLLENARYAYQAREAAPWGDQIPDAIFFNDVLPYVNINERRDAWRRDFFERFSELLSDVKSPGEAAALLNREIFPRLQVKYSTKRRRADQGPYESIDSGLASCTGLSILLIDACRANCIPARFVGTPLWSDKSGNHSWVEIWDQGWKFTGAAEPTGDALDRAWFVGRASQADPDHRLHAIYAVSYRRTPITFPLVWDRSIKYVHAVNVTPRYLNRGQNVPEGKMRLRFRVLGAVGQDRCRADLVVRDAQGQVVYRGKSRDESFDANDHATAVVAQGEPFEVEIQHPGGVTRLPIEAKTEGQLVTVRLTSDDDPIAGLEAYLKTPRDERTAIEDAAFAQQGLTRQQTDQAKKLLWKDHQQHISKTRKAEVEAKVIRLGDLEMKFDYKKFGKQPQDGWSLYISMHGGGGAPKRVNDQQWENQKRLYQLDEGIYLAPRAPNDAWNMWHQAHIDRFYTRLIEDLIVHEHVNPDRVYLTGYSAGGDGVFQLAPRMADQLAAAAMMAGHPNETQPAGLRNLPFTLHMGGKDSAYNRNKVAEQWRDKLKVLREQDPEGYEHWVEIYPDKGHWMDRKDASALPWMAKHRRNLRPERVVWKQDDVTHDRFYWLALDAQYVKARQEIVVQRTGREFQIEKCDADSLKIRLDDAMLDLDHESPISVQWNGNEVFRGEVKRTIATLARTLAERGDPNAMFSAELEVRLAKADNGSR